MCSNEVEKMIQQYGEAARKYKDKAIKIGNTYIIPNFGFDPRMEIYLDILLAPRKEWNHGLVDIRVFATPEDFVLFDFDEEVTEAQIDDLLSLLRELYPKDYTYAGLPEYWNEEDIKDSAEFIEPIDFAIWIQEKFRPDESEEEILYTWLKYLENRLGEEIIFYKFEDDENSNCGFAPYLFLGDSCLIIVVRCWEL